MKTRPTQKLFRRLRNSGFSLPEVTMALGIAAMGMSAVLGLLPHGLENMKKAGNVTAESRITQHILGDINQANWKDSSGGDLLAFSYNGRRYVFDEMAQLLEASRPGESTAYVAEVHLAPGGVMVPGGEIDPDLRRILVSVKNTANADFSFNDASPGSYKSYAMIVSGTGN